MWERKDNYNQETDEPVDEERKCDVEVWINKENYFWSWSTVPIRVNGMSKYFKYLTVSATNVPIGY